MATIDVLDAAGAEVAVELPNTNGRAAAASSRPVALSTEDLAAINAITAAFGTATFYPATQPVSGTVSVSGTVPVSGTFWQATQPVSAASLPLPTGAATSAKQDTIIGHVDGIETLLGGTLTITGAVTGPLTDAQLRATAVPVSGSVGISGPVAVTGTFWQATQPVSGTVSVTGVSTEATLSAMSGKLPASLGAKTGANSLSVAPASDATFNVNTHAVTQSGTWNIGSIATLPALVAGTAIIGKVGIDQATDGTTNKVNIDASLKSGTATRTTVASSTTSATILAANANRKGATIFNSDANALLLDLSGGTAAATRCQVRLTQYQSYEVGSGFTGAITGIWEADGTGQADVVEFT